MPNILMVVPSMFSLFELGKKILDFALGAFLLLVVNQFFKDAFDLD